MEDYNLFFSSKDEFHDKTLELVDRISDRLGDDFEVSCAAVPKNNSIMREGITIREKGRIVAPTVYLHDLFDGTEDEDDIDRIADSIVASYDEWMEGTQDINPEFFTFENMKEKIIFRMVNYSMNENMLKTTPHFCYRDLAVYFCCLVRIDSQGLGTVRITDDIARDWGVTAGDLRKYAEVNTPKLLPYTFSSMYSVLAGLLEREMSLHPDDCDVSRMKELLEYLENGDETKLSGSMFVLTTPGGINGASCLLYKGVLEEIADELGTGYYILPSSVNEVIIVPDTAEIGEEYLRAMVPEVNRSEVEPTEVLSDEIYKYPGDDFEMWVSDDI